MSAPSDTPTYLHGCSATEQARLLKQARLLEATLFNQIDYSGARGLLEVGSGVGAQTEILLRRFPGLHVTGVDLSEAQLVAARAHLERLAWCRERYTLQQADASDLPFAARQFDAAFLCWVLEHVPSPARVLNEVRRVLLPGSPVYVTEAECLVPAASVFAQSVALLDGVQRFPAQPGWRPVRRCEARQPAAGRRFPRRADADQDAASGQPRAGPAQDHDRFPGRSAALGGRPVIAGRRG
ncbi:methyltransferase [Xanthomonas oryzae pv. oryzae]|nr:methyltransferase [Xanthomonas oryzae pv. oryzae]OLI53197.1 methyltransferase [Xanthomonas oryzae pv. oryzae]OLK70758.1 methyltransferase [Xanthomonas oryzae pv. oryzae]